MAVLNVNPTRMEYSRLTRRLKTSMRGHKLLKDKRDDMMKRFLALARETLKLRREFEAGIKDVYEGFIIAEAQMGALGLGLALLVPYTENTDYGSAYPYGFAYKVPELTASIHALEEVLPMMFELARKEKLLHQLAMEIEHTRRRVNALEHVQIPTLQETIRSISMKLDENERADIARLMKVKDMLLARS